MSNGRVHALDLQAAAPARNQIITNALPALNRPPVLFVLTSSPRNAD
jgi:hypothetical protein